VTTLDAPPRRPLAPTLRAPSDRPEEIVSFGRGWWDRWWVAALVLPLMIASDWKLRRRASADALSGHADVQVIVEIGVYGLVAVYLALRHGAAPRLRRTTPLLFSMWLFGGILFFSAFYAVYPPLAIARGNLYRAAIVGAAAVSLAAASVGAIRLGLNPRITPPGLTPGAPDAGA